MLNFRNTNIVFVLLLLALLLSDLFCEVPVPVYLLLTFLYSLVLFYGSYFIRLQFFMKAICKAKRAEKKIAITFDDGPLKHYTPEILQILKTNNIKATFFCIGKNAAAHKDVLAEMLKQGHIIGSHSYSHGFWFDLLSAKNMQKDLEQAHAVFNDVLGINIKWFRPPYGVTNPNLKKAVEKMGYTAIGWSVRSLDTLAKDERALMHKLKKNLTAGSIFLFHDTVAITLKVLPGFIAYTRQMGFEIVSLDKLIHLQPYAD
ncbi:MAG: polysaccharide deacetylase family protein [Niabella sp.]